MTKHKTATFRLHPALDPAWYVMTDSLGDVASWRALCHSANSGGEKGVDELDEVGYVMISKTTDQIIPIARGDEHHRGYDTLHDLSEKLAIAPADFIPVWARGNNYIYDASETAELLDVLGKHLSYGGIDGILIGTQNMRGRLTTLSDFVFGQGHADLKPGSLAPLGTVLIGKLQALATQCAKARENPRGPQSLKAFKDGLALAKFLLNCAGQLHGPDIDALVAGPKAIRALRRERDVQGLTMLFFGPTGFKNGMHNGIREAMANRRKKDKGWFDEDTIAVWGDLDLAHDMMGRI